MTEFEFIVSKLTLEIMAENAFEDFECINCDRSINGYPVHTDEISCSDYCREEYIKFLNKEHIDKESK